MEQTILMKPVKKHFPKAKHKVIKETRIMHILSSFSYSDWQWVPGILRLQSEDIYSSHQMP